MVIINSQPNDKPTASEIGAVPVSRTVNGKSLNNDITLTANDVGAAASSSIPTKLSQLTNDTNFITASQASSMKITSGSYKGTGGTITINLDFYPLLVVVGNMSNVNNGAGYIAAPRGCNTFATAGNGDGSFYAYVTWGDDYVKLSGGSYFNPSVNNNTHYYVIIGQ